MKTLKLSGNMREIHLDKGEAVVQKAADLWYRKDGYNEAVRVWRDGWFGDQFEMLTEKEFRQLIQFSERFGWRILEAEDD